MDAIELKVYNETRIRNLQRRKAKLMQHPDCTAEVDRIIKEIKQIEKQL